MSLDTPLEARRAARSVSTPTMAIVGATGAVGVELLHCLEQRGFPLASLRLLASPRSAGREMPFRGRTIIVEAVDCDSFEGVDIALFSAGSTISKQYAPLAVAAGAVVVDNSSAFRMQPDVPLVVPEVNAAVIADQWDEQRKPQFELFMPSRAHN